ncbi:cupin domain-containing protein [Paenibacillus sp. NPDC055715]
MEKNNLAQFQEYQENTFTKRIIHKEAENVIFILNFSPGTELPTHNHPGANVYILVLDGHGVVTSNGTETAVAKGDIIHITGDESFSYRNGTDIESSLYVVLTKTPNEHYAQNI